MLKYKLEFIRRVGILKHTLLNGGFGGSFGDWIMNCFYPTNPVLAKRKIELIEKSEESLKIKLKNYDHFIYYPATFQMQQLYQTLTEQLYDWNWHFYQIPQTTVTSDDVVLDCGCAEGVFTFLNKDIAKHIYAFEPHIDYVNNLKKTFKEWSNVSVMKYALGDKCGKVYFEKKGYASFITTKKTDTSVDVKTVDSVCEEFNIDASYIKVDLEGYEMNLLKGAPKTIQKHKPKIAITTYHGKYDYDNIIRYLKELVPSYTFLAKGVEGGTGSPIMLHAW